MSTERGCLAIIPARGGSKGIPRKNVLPLCGKPLITWTIQAAKGSKTVDRLIVSTDDAEIGDASRRERAEVLQRPAELGSDTASSESVLLHVLQVLHANEGYQPEVVVLLQCTSPLMIPEDIDGTVKVLLNEQADSALSVSPFHHYLWRKGDETALGINHDKRFRLRRQEQEPQYVENGAVYAMKHGGFLQARHRFFGKTAFHVTPASRHLEIDESTDFELAELRLRRREASRQYFAIPTVPRALVLDFDGVFTDNTVLVLGNGQEAVFCNRSDGLGLSEVRNHGLETLVISTETSPVVEARCSKLGLKVIHSCPDKLKTLSQWLEERSIDISDVIYLGNDINDLDCINAAGCGVATADAHYRAKAVSKIVLSSSGGHGAIRELCDLIVRKLAAPPDLDRKGFCAPSASA